MALNSGVETRNSGVETRNSGVETLNCEGLREITCAVMGSVDSGKSTLVGVLTKDILDDGKGSARSYVMRHPHELKTGNTSDISYKYVQMDDTIVTFIDLAGHEDYLRTTVNGLSSGVPDYALLCVSDKITNMTLEHMRLLVLLNIPFIIIVTKIDFIPKNVHDKIITSLNKTIRSIGKRLYEVKNEDDVKTVENDNLCPMIKLSNKNGDGLLLLKSLMRCQQKRGKNLIKGFSVDYVYRNVPGTNVVVSGISGDDIRIGDSLHFNVGRQQINVSVISIHNDYRFGIQALTYGKRGCLNLRVHKNDKKQLSKGTILTHDDITPVKIFTADLFILHHTTSISDRYEAFANCGMIRGTVKFNHISRLDKFGNETECKDVVRSGDKIRAVLEFKNEPQCIVVGQNIICREGGTKCIGKIISIPN